MSEPVWVLCPTTTRADLPWLGARFGAFLRARAGPACQAGPADRAGPAVTVDLAAVAEPDLVIVDALARLRLIAARHGCRLRVRGASDRLRQLLALVGLAKLLVEPGRQAEHREQPGGVEEEAEPDDPTG